jgi:hypothetical protein
MRIIPILLLFVGFLGQCQKSIPIKQENYPLLCSGIDSIAIEKLLNNFRGKQELSTSELSIEIARTFLNTPYVGKTLECNDEEMLVINLHELDCSTLVENCLALAKTFKSHKATKETYFNWLRTIRYRDGILWGYESRLHYFSEWIRNNEKKGFIADATQKLGGVKYPNEVYFMGTHPSAYKQLVSDSCMIERIKHIEEQISKERYFHIPKEKVNAIEGKLKEGMLVGITTNIEGLDIIHTGFLIQVNGRIHLLHASSDQKKVVISDKPLSEYLMENKRQTGIMIIEIL